MRAVERVGDWLDLKREMAEAAERNVEALHQDLADHDRELERTSRSIPQERELERFAESLAGWSEEYGIQVVSQSSEVIRGERYDHCVIRLELRGDGASLLDLEQWPGKLRRTVGGRLTSVRRATLNGDVLEVELVLFSAPAALAGVRNYGEPPPWPEPKVRL